MRPFKLCRAILEGLVEEMKQRGLVPTAPRAFGQMEREDESDSWPELVGAVLSVVTGTMKGLLGDATTVQALREDLVKAARELEMSISARRRCTQKDPARRLSGALAKLQSQ